MLPSAPLALCRTKIQSIYSKQTHVNMLALLKKIQTSEKSWFLAGWAAKNGAVQKGKSPYPGAATPAYPPQNNGVDSILLIIKNGLDNAGPASFFGVVPVLGWTQWSVSVLGWRQWSVPVQGWTQWSELSVVDSYLLPSHQILPWSQFGKQNGQVLAVS